jgi:hypothetical protein
MPEPLVADAWSPVMAAFKNLRPSWPQRGWSWDSRQNCVASSFGTDLDQRVRTTLSSVLSVEWSPTRVSAAPPEVREVADRSGGLRAGQLLLTTTVPARYFAFALWWPWGDGLTTSLRIGLGGNPREDAYARLRDVFGVSL